MRLASSPCRPRTETEVRAVVGDGGAAKEREGVAPKIEVFSHLELELEPSLAVDFFC